MYKMYSLLKTVLKAPPPFNRVLKLTIQLLSIDKSKSGRFL